MGKINIPQIRFKGFDGEWNGKKLEDSSICTIDTGCPFDSNDFEENGKYLVITNGNIQDESSYVNSINCNRITIDKKSPFILNKGEILVTMDGTVGRTAIVNDYGMVLAQRVGRLKPIVNGKYLYYMLNTGVFSKTMITIGHGGTIKHISLKEIGSYNLCFSESTEEQTKIASLFTSLDKQISTSEAKLDKLRTIKKTLLKKMFAAQGELTPQIRFKGFDGAWEEKKLVDFVHFFNGQTYTPNDVKSSGTLVLRSSNVQNDKISLDDNVFIDSSCANVNNVKKGDIIVVVRNGSRSLIGKHAVIEKEMPDTVIGAFMTGIRSDIPYFTNALLSSPMFEKKVSENLGATINQITGYMFERMNFNIPSLPKEQACIASLFNSLDKQINLQEQKIEKLKAIKKTLLKKMFV